LRKILYKAAAAAFWVAVWQLLYVLVGQDLIVASPRNTALSLWALGCDEKFWLSVGLSCARVVAGFLLAVLVGGLLAVLTSRSPLLHTLFAPLLGVVRATPVASFIMLALIWIATGRLTMFIAFLTVIPIVWQNVQAGILNVDAQLLEVARLFRFSRRRTFSLVVLPQVMPYLVSACSMGVGFAWKSAIAAEIIGRPAASIGRGVYNAKNNLETADLFAWTVAVIALSVLIEKLALWALNRLARWLSHFRSRGWSK